jgi:integrase
MHEPPPHQPQRVRVSRPKTRRRNKVPSDGITDAWVADRMKRPIKGSRVKQFRYFDKLSTGLAIRLSVNQGGAVTIHIVTYNRLGEPLYKKLGRWPAVTIAKAKEEAREYFRHPERYRAAQDAPTLGVVYEKWVFERVERRKLRSEAEWKRVYTRYIAPELGHVNVYEVDRRAVNRLLSDLSDTHGVVIADKCLMILSSMLGWWQVQDEHYSTVIVRGMKRYHHVPRTRMLSDDELRRLWAADGRVAALMKFGILTGQRKAKLTGLRHAHISDGVWTIETEPREKGNGRVLKLPAMALHLLPEVKDPDARVFEVGNLQRRASALLAKLGIEGFTVHDCRRTHRSLASRARVPRHVAERIIGHAQPQLDQIYDQYQQDDEKAAGLQAVADLISSIVDKH